MASYLSDYLAVYQYLTLPGFLYIIGLIFLFQAFTEFNAYNTLKKYKKFIFYISILTLIFSFVIGLSIYLTEQKVYDVLLSEDLRGVPKYGTDISNYNNIYGVLIMMRHLLVSITFIVVSFSLYMKRNGKILMHKVFYLVMYAIIILILTCAYLKLKGIVGNLNRNSNVKELWIVVTISVIFLFSFIAFFTIDSEKRKYRWIFPFNLLLKQYS